MTSGETLPRGKATSGSATGIVLVAHGGQASSTEPTWALQPAVLRMIPVGAAIRHALRGVAPSCSGPVSGYAAGTARRPPRSAT